MPSIRDFSGGVLNQELQNRDNGNGVLFDCKNVLSSWNGELRKRTGTRLLQQLESDSKLIPYRLPSGDDMLMVLDNTNIKCYVFNEDGNLVPYVVGIGPNIPFPNTGWSSNTLGDWTVSTNFGTPTEAWKAVNAPTPFSIALTIQNNRYYGFENQTAVVMQGAIFHWVYTNVHSTEAVFRYGDSPIIQYSDDGTDWHTVNTNYTVLSKYKETRHTSFPSLDITTSHVVYDVRNSGEITAHKFWRVLFERGVNEGTPTDTSMYPTMLINAVFREEGTPEQLIFGNCPYGVDDFNNIKWSQNGSVLTMACKGKIPYQVLIDGGYLMGRTFTPSDETSIWTNNGYPSSVVYYQNRLWFGGFEDHPTRVWGSAFGNGNFDKFTVPTTIEKTSPIMVDGTEISGTIENMWGGNNALYCLSEDGVSMIDAQGAIVATDQVEFKLRNREPVNDMTPTVKNDVMVYLGRDKRKIFITDYDFVVQRFKAVCISDNYNDFFQSGIKEMHYIPRKSSLIYGVLENGKWFALLFDLDKGKNALFPFETDGLINDIQPIKHGDATKLLMVTKLPSYQYVLEEKMPQADQEIMDFMTKQEQQDYTAKVLNSEQAHLDHFITRHTDTNISSVGNLPYYSGGNIDVIADGNYLGKKEVLKRDSSALFAWLQPSGEEIIYTDIENPTTSSIVYDENYSEKSDYIITNVVNPLGTLVTSIIVNCPMTANFSAYKNYDVEPKVVYITTRTSSFAVFSIDEAGEVSMLGLASSVNENELVFNGNTYARDYTLDRDAVMNVTNTYEKSTENNITASPYYVDLGGEAKDIIIGVPYDSYAVLKFVSPYNLRKFPKEISVNFINSGYLEVGNTFDSLKSVLNNLVESVTIDNKKILMNGNYTKTLDKQTFETPYVIVRSDKGLPFIITGIDYKVDMSNYQGGV